MSSLRGDRKTSFGGGAGGVNAGRVSFGIDCSCTGSIGGTINVRSFGPDLSGSREGQKKAYLRVLLYAAPAPRTAQTKSFPLAPVCL